MAGVLNQQITDRWAIYNADAMDVMAAMPDQSIHASIYSPPFAGLYIYSSNDRDVSNARNYNEFREHYGMFVQQIHRLTKPGRLTAVHAAPIPSGNSGRDALFDFPGDVIRLHEEHGWEWVGRHAIWKEPLSVRLRTMQKNLAHKTIIDDGAQGGVASADELLIFRKPGDGHPVTHPTGLDDYAGSEPIPADLMRYRRWEGKQTANRYSQWIWRHYASSVWDDIRLDHVLPFRDAKDPDDEKHVHPLQLDVIARFVQLRTRPGETILTPFMGVGSEVYESVRLGRIGVGIELKPSYYAQAARNLAAVDQDRFNEPSLLDELAAQS
ncbi:DNA-methyltransferase [Occultella kanbiaonis]|uniref:DNA-methyltransferase n=1 Tax=Occultella kanbiaonis TaxID=2675754 RepID=UPI0013D7216A|nr:DNA methyltransferase [Occultella kanbiaonis]